MMINNAPQKEYQVPEILIDAIPGYIERRDKDIVELESFAEKQDFDSVGKIAHKLIGSGSSYGFEEITALGEKLQQAAGQKDAQEIMNLAENLKSEVSNIKLKVLFAH